MANFPVSGSASAITVGLETTYGSVSGAVAGDTMIAFGHNQKINVERNMNTRGVWGLGSPYASKAYSGLFEGRLTIDFTLASTYFMELVMGKCTDADDATYGYSHTYADNTGYTVTSCSIENGVNLDTDSVFVYLGCVVDSCELRARIGESVDITLNMLYAEETKATSGLDTSPDTDTEEPLVFSEGSLDIPDGTTLARVQSFTLRFIKNAQLIAGLGDRCPSKAVWRNMAFEFDLEISYENADLIEDMYGQATGPLTATNPAGEATLTLMISNAGSGTARRHLEIKLTNTFITSDSLPQNIEEHMVHRVRGFCLNAPTSIIGMDNTATSPLVSS